MSETIVLKKYANRRLYDTERSVYVTLNDVEDMIRSGRYVQVVDAKTGEDVTAFTLTQIILEKARMESTLLPVPVLHLLIQFGDNLLNEFFQKYLQDTLRNYLAYKTALDEQFKNWLELGMNLSDLAPKTTSDFKAFKQFYDIFSYWDRQGKKE